MHYVLVQTLEGRVPARAVLLLARKLPAQADLAEAALAPL
jgi:hypothetical protein